MTRKVFRVPERPPRRPEFTLGEQDFDCTPDDQVSSLDLLGKVAAFTGGSGIERIQAMVAIFAEFIPSDDGQDAVEETGTPGEEGYREPRPAIKSTQERFNDVVRAQRVPPEMLGEIASWVLNEYLNFPTQEENPQSGQSSNGSTTGLSSNAAGSSAPQAAISTA